MRARPSSPWRNPAVPCRCQPWRPRLENVIIDLTPVSLTVLLIATIGSPANTDWDTRRAFILKVKEGQEGLSQHHDCRRFPRKDTLRLHHPSISAKRGSAEPGAGAAHSRCLLRAGLVAASRRAGVDGVAGSRGTRWRQRLR